MKTYFNIIMLFFIVQVFSQEYDRTWGTYFGADGTSINDKFIYKKALFDSNGKLHFTGSVHPNSQYNTAYYNQFITTGPSCNVSANQNTMNIILNNNGTLYNSEFVGEFATDISIGSINNFEINNDSMGNIFGTIYNSQNINDVGTAGTWFSSPINGILNKEMLTKRNSSGAIIWKTFLPDIGMGTQIVTDNAGCVYVSGETYLQSGLSTPGAFQEVYDVIYGPSNEILPNSYLAKLSPNGELIWATYLPNSLINFRVYGDFLYILGGSDTNPAKTELATTNAFQTEKSYSIAKYDCATGHRTWGTYYGIPLNNLTNGYSLLSNIEVNQTGLYIIGDYIDLSGNANAYFGTSGAFQPVSSGSSDIVISKFNLDGQRIWSTYFGSPGEEYVGFSSSSIALNGNDLFFTLLQLKGTQSTNLATPGAYIDAPPTNPNSNLAQSNNVFAKFNTNGSLQWSSYYGGATETMSEMLPLNITIANNNTFYLYGYTRSDTGFTTPGAIQSNNFQKNKVAYFARFDKKTEMSTTETDHIKDLVLYNNPNNGAFALQGSVLQKKALQMAIYDGAGRLILQQKLNKDYQQSFDFSHQLKTGNYFLELKDNKQLIKSFKLIVK